MSNFRRISFIAIGIYWLACGALMCLRPELVAPQSLDPLQLNHGATILGILYLLGGTIMLMPSRLARKIFRTRSSTLPEEHLSPRRQWASLLLLWLTSIAAPLAVLVLMPAGIALICWLLMSFGPLAWLLVSRTAPKAATT